VGGLQLLLEIPILSVTWHTCVQSSFIGNISATFRCLKLKWEIVPHSLNCLVISLSTWQDKFPSVFGAHHISRKEERIELFRIPIVKPKPNQIMNVNNLIRGI
jgi:hypothetical protein